MAERIASLLAASTEALFGIGLGDCVVAVSHECDRPEAARTRPRATRARINAAAASGDIDREVRACIEAGTALYEVDTELLARLRPDLIITQSQCEVCAVSYDDVIAAVRNAPALRDARVLAMNPNTLDEVLRDIQRIAHAAGAAEAGEHYVAALRARVDAVRARSASIAPDARPRVVCIEWTDPLMVAANWMPGMIHLAGGRCDLTRDGEHSRTIPWADVRAYDPQVIIVAPCGFDLPRAAAEARTLCPLPGWSSTSAARAGRVFAADGNALFNRSGPSLVDTLELLAGLVEPSRHPLPTWSAAAVASISL